MIELRKATDTSVKRNI